jgi:hypothetical protein
MGRFPADADARSAAGPGEAHQRPIPFGQIFPRSREEPPLITAGCPRVLRAQARATHATDQIDAVVEAAQKTRSHAFGATRLTCRIRSAKSAFRPASPRSPAGRTRRCLSPRRKASRSPELPLPASFTRAEQRVTGACGNTTGLQSAHGSDEAPTETILAVAFVRRRCRKTDLTLFWQPDLLAQCLHAQVASEKRKFWASQCKAHPDGADIDHPPQLLDRAVLVSEPRKDQRCTQRRTTTACGRARITGARGSQSAPHSPRTA